MAAISPESEATFSISIVPPTLASAVTLRLIESSAVQESSLSRLLWPPQPDDPSPPPSNTDNTDPERSHKDKAQDDRALNFLQDPINQFFLVTDNVTGHGVAFSWWQQNKGKSDEDWAELYKNRFRSPRLNQALSDATNGARLLKRGSILKNREYFTLKELFVRPEYQRKGLGGRLVKWGVEKADELGLPAYIEATAKGLGLYTKFGFEVVDAVSVDLEPFGGEKGDINTFTLLLREAKKV